MNIQDWKSHINSIINTMPETVILRTTGMLIYTTQRELYAALTYCQHPQDFIELNMLVSNRYV